MKMIHMHNNQLYYINTSLYLLYLIQYNINSTFKLAVQHQSLHLNKSQQFSTNLNTNYRSIIFTSQANITI